MPDDCFKFKNLDAFNDDFTRQDEFKLITETSEPFADVFKELGAGTETVQTNTFQTDGSGTFDGIDTGFVEGSGFDFL